MSGLRAGALRAIRAQPMAALGLLILLAWSVAALGAIGGGAGWMRIACYDPDGAAQNRQPRLRRSPRRRRARRPTG